MIPSKASPARNPCVGGRAVRCRAGDAGSRIEGMCDGVPGCKREGRPPEGGRPLAPSTWNGKAAREGTDPRTPTSEASPRTVQLASLAYCASGRRLRRRHRHLPGRSLRNLPHPSRSRPWKMSSEAGLGPPSMSGDDARLARPETLLAGPARARGSRCLEGPGWRRENLTHSQGFQPLKASSWVCRSRELRCEPASRPAWPISFRIPVPLRCLASPPSGSSSASNRRS